MGKIPGEHTKTMNKYLRLKGLVFLSEVSQSEFVLFTVNQKYEKGVT